MIQSNKNYLRNLTNDHRLAGRTECLKKFTSKQKCMIFGFEIDGTLDNLNFVCFVFDFG
jgi:hypothetical protein